MTVVVGIKSRSLPMRWIRSCSKPRSLENGELGLATRPSDAKFGLLSHKSQKLPGSEFDHFYLTVGRRHCRIEYLKRLSLVKMK